MNHAAVRPGFTCADVGYAARAAHRLHVLEGRPPGDAAETEESARRFLSGSGCRDLSVFVAARADGTPCGQSSACGCVVVQYDALPGWALAGCLWVDPDAPRGAALRLMAAAAGDARAWGHSEMYLLAGTERNRRRRTYRRLGFRETGITHAGAALMVADLGEIERGLQRRLKTERL